MRLVDNRVGINLKVLPERREITHRMMISVVWRWANDGLMVSLLCQDSKFIIVPLVIVASDRCVWSRDQIELLCQLDAR